MIKAVIFDMYETLVTQLQSPLYYGTQIAQDLGLAPEAFLPEWRNTEEDRATGKQTFEEVMEMLMRQQGIYTRELHTRVVERRIAVQSDCFSHLHPRILLMLGELKKRGIKIGLITNCFSEEAKLIRESALFPFFDGACLSWEAGVRKPDPAIYYACLEKLGIPAISTGNMLREAMANGSELGQMVKKIMDEGSLVPDGVILDIVAERVAKSDCRGGFILDGVPRTLAQAEALDAKGVRIDHVVSIEVDDEVIEGRMTGRRVCSKCGASYHIVANPPKAEGVCDQCGSALVIRKDDAPETVRHRLEVYHETTEVLKSYYAKQGKLRLVDGNQPIEDAFRDVLKAIGAKV